MQQPDRLKPNTNLSRRYVITEHLGGGGFGQTYLATDQYLPTRPKCVVKQFKPQVTQPGTLQIAKRLFDTEADVLYKLGSHTQIPRLLAHFEEDQEFFLVQEFIEGHDLEEELILGKKWNEVAVTSMMLEILEILSFVHRENVIHRDIKPSNVIRRKIDGKLVLIDFGAVKQVSANTFIPQQKTALTVAIGTLGYMPNEQSNGKPRFCSDVYSVGIIGIQALTGLHPAQFQEDPATGEIAWHDQAQVSPKLMEILDKMVRYDFRQRYPSALAVLEDLRSLQALDNSYPSENQAPHLIAPTLPSSPSTEQTYLPAQDRNSLSTPGSVQKILVLGGLVGIFIITGLALVTTVQLKAPKDSSSPEPLQASSIPSTLSPTAQADDSSAISDSSPSSPTWIFFGSASTGETIYIDSASIRKTTEEITFTYKIGNDLLLASADCRNNQWYVDEHGWYSPQSEATQRMLNYICNY